MHNYLTPPVASVPTNLMAVQEGPTSIRVSWSPPTPLGDTTGYRIYYSDSDSVDVSGGSTDNYLLTGLQNGTTYTISIVAISDHFFSKNISVRMIQLIIAANKCACNHAGPVIGGMIASSVFTVGAVLVIMMVIRKRRHRKKDHTAAAQKK